MLKMLAHPIYAWMGLIGAKVTAVVGVASGVKDEDIMGMDAEDWFGLSSLYMLFVLVALVARLVIKQESKD